MYSAVGDIISTLGGYHDLCGGISSVHWGLDNNTDISQCADDIPQCTAKTPDALQARSTGCLNSFKSLYMGLYSEVGVIYEKVYFWKEFRICEKYALLQERYKLMSGFICFYKKKYQKRRGFTLGLPKIGRKSTADEV